MRRMAPPWLLSAALRFDDEEYEVADLVLLAVAEGHWQSLEARLARGLALEREHGRGVAPGRVAEEVKRFRYGRRLISAKELRQWLAARALVLEDLRRHCLRTVLVAEYGDSGDRVSHREFAGVLAAEATISPTLHAAAVRLGDLAAMAAAGRSEGRPTGADVSELLAEAAAHPAAGLAGLGAGDLEHRAERILALLRAEAGFVQRVATPRALARCFAEHGIDWLRVACSELTLATEGAARESMLCLRVDRITPVALARQLEVTLRVREHYLSDLSDASAPVLASAALGEPVGPFLSNAGWSVRVVNRRVAPTGEDPELVRRATAAVVQTARGRIKAGRARELAAL
jgi:hypothetical protein